MRSIAFRRNKYSGDLYKFVRETIGDTSELKYYFAGKILLSASLDISGRMLIKSDEPITIGCLVANITDSNNNIILDNAIWQINGVEPVLSSFNTIEEYRHKANKFQGTI